MLKLEHVYKSFSGVSGGQELCVLKDINLFVGKGESVSVVGPSGSGKSTLLNIIGGLDKPDKGKVIIDGQNIVELTETFLARVRNQQVGFVFQLYHLLPQCTVLENVLVPTLASTGFGAASGSEKRARDLLGRVGLADRMNHRPGELSGGQRQRVAVVRALINRPALLLADEPTGSLDKASAERIGELLIELNRSESVALIIVTHSLVLAERAQRVFELDDGILAKRAGV
jgi:ABC-type lipoprotein export system ATPase subunit